MSGPLKDAKAVLMLLFILAFATLMDGMDGSIVNIALPTIAGEMGADTGTISWVTTAYYMSIAGTILLFARIAKNGNIKKVFTCGLLLFLTGSVLCSVSISLPMLISFRIIQGLGAAMMGASAPMACVRYLPINKLGLGLGVITLGCSLGYTLGPAIGGFIVDALSWHWIFLINIPLCIIALPILLKAIPKDDVVNKSPVDLLGAAIFFVMIASGMMALERSTYSEDRIAVIIATILFVVCLITFITVELRKHMPLLNVRVFKSLRFDAVTLSFLLVNFSYMGILYLMPFFFVTCMGFSPTTCGLYILLPSVITLLFVVPLSRWSDRIGRRPFSIASCIFLTLAFMIMALCSETGDTVPLVIALILMGMTWATCGGAMASRIVENTEFESREMGSSLMTESTYIGCAAGTAFFAMIFTLYTGSGNTGFTNLAPEIFLNGYVFCLSVALIIGIICTVLSAAVNEKKNGA